MVPFPLPKVNTDFTLKNINSLLQINSSRLIVEDFKLRHKTCKSLIVKKIFSPFMLTKFNKQLL